MAGNNKLWLRIKQFFLLMKLYAKMDLEWFTQDTFVCVGTVISETLANLSAAGGVFLLAIRFGGVGLLSTDEVLFMLGFYTMVKGLYNTFFMGYNTGDISRRIGRGQLDHMLIMPIPLPMQLLVEGFLPVSGSGTLLAGLAVTIIAIVRLGIPVTAGFIALTLLYLVSALFIIIGVSYIVALAAFYHPAGSEEISSVATDSLYELGAYPLSGLGSIWQGLLCTALPAGTMAWLPTMLLLGKEFTLSGALFMPLFALLLCGTATLLFKKGMRYYAKYGSQRYSNVGHRC